jgi:hypothetical protein
MNNNILCANLSLIPEFNTIINKGEDSLNILKLNKVNCVSSNLQDGSSYTVIRYDKDFLNIDLIETYGLCRSIILNSDNNVVSFAPPKSIPSDRFILKYSENKDNIIAQEFVEGTMINVFWNDKIGLTGGWEIATRNTVGANSSFYKSSKTKTFRQMFLEAAKENNLVLERLNPKYCYSFVLQHPDNRIVVPFHKLQLYLVAMYHIDNSDKNNIIINSINNITIRNLDWQNSSIKFPEIYSFENYSELIEKYASMNTSYNILGVVLYNYVTGERCKIRNPVYEQVRNLRGNQPKLQYQYLSLRKEGKVKDFLKFYPENKKEFSSFRDQVHLFTNTLVSNYISCYIKKEKPLIEFSQQYRSHMFHLHQKYINELREKKMFITSTIVCNYVNNLHPSILMFTLNFQMRKRNIDFITANENELN